MTEGYPSAWTYDTANPGTATTDVVNADSATAAPFASPELDAGPADSSAEQGKAGAAKEQAAAVGQGAAQAGQQVAAVARDQAQSVVAEAGTQAKDLLGQARSELTEQAAAQQTRLASGLRALGDELEAMTHHSAQAGVATDLAKQAATRSHDVASWLDAREPGHLLDEVQSFARQRPAAFLALAAGAGLLAGRLGRGVKDAGDTDAPDTAQPDTAQPGTVQPDTAAQPVTAADAVPSEQADEVRPFASSQVVSRDEILDVGGTQ